MQETFHSGEVICWPSAQTNMNITYTVHDVYVFEMLSIIKLGIPCKWIAS